MHTVHGTGRRQCSPSSLRWDADDLQGRQRGGLRRREEAHAPAGRGRPRPRAASPEPVRRSPTAATVPPCGSRPGTSTRSSSACRGCCRGSTSAGPTSSACRRPSSPTTRFAELLGERARRARLRGRGARRGGLERRGDPLARRARGRRRAACRAARASRIPEARAVAATCGGVRVVSVYVPNGRAPDSDHYAYKLEWLAALRDAGRRRAGDDRGLRRREHRAGRRGRLRPRRLRRARRTSRRPSAPRSPSSRRSACATSCATAGPTSASSPTGTTAPACSTRTCGMRIDLVLAGDAGRRARARPRGSTARRARARARATTRR